MDAKFIRMIFVRNRSENSGSESFLGKWPRSGMEGAVQVRACMGKKKVVCLVGQHSQMTRYFWVNEGSPLML